MTAVSQSCQMLRNMKTSYGHLTFSKLFSRFIPSQFKRNVYFEGELYFEAIIFSFNQESVTAALLSSNKRMALIVRRLASHSPPSNETFLLNCAQISCLYPSLPDADQTLLKDPIGHSFKIQLALKLNISFELCPNLLPISLPDTDQTLLKAPIGHLLLVFVFSNAL